MNRKKPPALTSPWKIGFFVSLLLIATSIGVGYFITRSFGLTWSWLHFGGTSWQSWAFYPEAFMRQMLPLVVMVPVLSLLSYFLIVGAVRKYKAYLDSGLDYKNLVQSIKQIEDLQDEERIKKLNNHPDLRDFLLNVKSRVAEREAALEQREHDIVTSATASNESLVAETSVLVSAIFNAREDGFKDDLALTIPQFKEIEGAIKKNLLNGAGDDSSAMLDTLAVIREDVNGLSSELERLVGELSGEVAACENAAREVESQCNQYKAEAGGAGADTAAAAQALGQLDGVAQTLRALTEEAKGIAINAAMQAGNGHAGANEMVAVADAVRGVAAKFSQVADQWNGASGGARNAIAQAGQGAGGGPGLDNVAHKVGLWVERAVVLSDKFRTFKKHHAESLNAIEVKLGGTPRDTYGDIDEINAEVAPAPGMSPDPAEAPADSGDDFVRQGQTPVLDPAAPVTSDTGTFEKDKRLFEEISTGAEESFFEDIPGDAVATEPAAPAQPPVPETPPVAEAPVAREPQPQPQPEPAADSGFEIEGTSLANKKSQPEPEPAPVDEDDDDGFVQDPAVAPSTPRAEESAAEMAAMQSTTAEADEDNVIDLYALGAVDYQPDGVHQGI